MNMGIACEWEKSVFLIFDCFYATRVQRYFEMIKV